MKINFVKGKKSELNYFNIEMGQGYNDLIYTFNICKYLTSFAVDRENERFMYKIKPSNFELVFDYYEPEITDVTELKLKHNAIEHWLYHSVNDYNIYYDHERKTFIESPVIIIDDLLREIKVYWWFFIVKYNVALVPNANKKKGKELEKFQSRIGSIIEPSQHQIIKYMNNYYRVTSRPKIIKIDKDYEIVPVQTSAMDTEDGFDVVIRKDYDRIMLEQINLNMYVVYDVETLMIEKKHYVFMVYAQIFTPGTDAVAKQIAYTCKTFEECKNHTAIDYMLNSINDYILSTENTIKGGIRFCHLIGFNNYKFDDSFIRAYAVKNYDSVSYSERKNASNSTEVKLACGTIVRTFDVMKWCPGMSLAMAAKSYKLPQEKIEFNIVKYIRYLVYQYQGDQLDKVDVSLKTLVGFFNGSLDEWRANAWKNQNGTYDSMKACQYYCEFDVYVTLLLFNRIYTSIKEIIEFWNEEFKTVKNDNINNNFVYLKTPSTAAMELQMKINRHDNKFFYRVNTSIYKRTLDKAYYGGRTDFSHIGLIDKPIIYYDVCGMYSLAMKANYPSSEPVSLSLLACYEKKEHETIKIKLNKLYNEWKNVIEEIYIERMNNPSLEFSEKFKYFDNNGAVLLCHIYPPSEDLQLPSSPIGFKSEDKTSTTYANTTRKFIILTSIHIRTLLFCHYRVEILDAKCNVYYEEMKPLLSKYNQILTKKKTEYQLAGNTSGRALIKLFLNSLYGKLAQNTWANILKYEQVECAEEEIFTPIIEKENQNSYLYLGAFVTAYANHVLIESMYQACIPYMKKNNTIKRQTWLYCDTDSLILDAEYAYNFNPTLGNECGTYDINTSKFNSIWEKENYDGIVILGKKSYALLKNGEFVDKKFKGLPAKSLATFDFATYKKHFTPLSNLLSQRFNVIMEDRLIRKRKRECDKVDIIVDYVQESLSRIMRVNNKLYVLLNSNNRNDNCLAIDKYSLYDNSMIKKFDKFNTEKFEEFIKTGKCGTCAEIIDSSIFSLKTFQCYKCEVNFK